MRYLLAAATTMLLAQTAMAKDPVFVTSKSIADKPIVAPDAKLGYLLLRTTVPVPVYIVRIPSRDDEMRYNAMRNEALAKERDKYKSKMRTYQADLDYYEKNKGDNKNKNVEDRLKKPIVPVEPKDENFIFTPFSLLAGVSIGPTDRFAKLDGGGSVYLQALTPGTYRLYGLVNPLVGAGLCFCMGSVAFTAEAGEVTNLGELAIEKMLSGGELTPGISAEPLDPRLKEWPVHPANFRAAGKLPNFFGGTISRLPAIPGVLGYDRDTILDLKATPQPAKP